MLGIFKIILIIIIVNVVIIRWTGSQLPSMGQDQIAQKVIKVKGDPHFDILQFIIAIANNSDLSFTFCTNSLISSLI